MAYGKTKKIKNTKNMNKEFEKELHRLLVIYKMNLSEEINAFNRNVNLDFEKLETELKKLIETNEKLREQK